jgi:hypothetical protein
MAEPLTPAQTDRLRRLLLRKGGEISQRLSELLAGQNPSVDGLLGGGRPGEKPIERLRRFLALVEIQLQAIRAGTYGRCASCQEPLPYVELEQMPWLDTCQTCARAAAEAEGVDVLRGR